VAAMQKTADGPVVYDGSKCMGCRYCLMACPYGIPRYEWHTSVPYVRKCNLCYERLQAGMLPACVDACPEQAVIFGQREVLLAEARHRLKAEPGRYIQNIDGEHEVGGTSILYISDTPLDFLSVNRYSGQEALPDLTEPWLSQVPLIALGMTALMAAPYWIIKRRMRLAAAREKARDEAVAKADDEERTETDE
jgi:formate dehydrogenase iron-sulfur subunit